MIYPGFDIRKILAKAILFSSLCAMAHVTAQPLPKVHPSYTLKTIRPLDFEPQVSGMDLLPDGRLLVLTHEPVRSEPVKPGAMYTVEGVKGNGPYTVKKVVSGVYCGTGLRVQDGGIFITEKERLLEILDVDGGEIALDRKVPAVAGKYRTIHKYGYDANFHQYAFGPLLRKEADGKDWFYVGLSTAWPENQNKSKNRTSLLKISREGETVDTLLSGIRTPNGLSFAPDGSGEMFQTDNQGGWLPASKLNNLRPGRFYGFFNNAGAKFDKVPPSPPAVWMPHGAISNSPTDPTFLKIGSYKGNVIMGDIFYGGLQRIYLEKIKGEYQGAVFRFSGGLEAGINQIVLGEDGTLYLGGMGSGYCSCWLWPGGKEYGLQKLVPNGKTQFDFLAVRSTGPNTMELRFTEPLAATEVNTADFAVRSWHYQPTSSYGGPSIGTKTLGVRSATITPDGMGVSLTIDGLAVGTVVHVVIKAMTSKAGSGLWQNEAWYTLNDFGPGSPIEPGVVSVPNAGKPGLASGFAGMRGAHWDAGGLRLRAPIAGPWSLEIRNAMGQVVRSMRGEGDVSGWALSPNEFPTGMYLLGIRNPSGSHVQKIMRY